MTVTPGEQRTDLTKLIDADVLERVQKGLRWLEETHGPGWEDKIDLRKLDLRNGEFCVLGQVYSKEAKTEHAGGYSYALDELININLDEGDETEALAVEMGFTSADYLPPEWDELQQAWELVLRDRLLTI